MYVCICKGITERQIQAAVDVGCSSMRELRAQTDIASCCGKCGRHARDVFEQSLERSQIANKPTVGYFEPQVVTA